MEHHFRPGLSTAWLPSGNAIPVRIKRHIGVYRIVISPPDKLQTPMSIGHHPETFHDYVLTLPAWEKGLLMHLEWNLTSFEIFQFLNSSDEMTLLIIPDGSSSEASIWHEFWRCSWHHSL